MEVVEVHPPPSPSGGGKIRLIHVALSKVYTKPVVIVCACAQGSLFVDVF